MAGVIDVMSDAAGSLDYAIDALEAPAGSHMRQVSRELKEARYTVAAMLDALELAYQKLGFWMDEEKWDDGDEAAMVRIWEAISKAGGGA
jgi:hypothetical protein